MKITALVYFIFGLSFTFGPISFAQQKQEEDPIEVQIGEKLFNDDRFSFLFFKNSKGVFNSHLSVGDASLDVLETRLGVVDHPLRGQHMSCAACHLVDQAQDVAGVVNYNDFALRSPVPAREDGEKTSLRHSQNLVMSSLQDGTPLHWDGEFYSAKDLSRASLVGRNMGWLPREAPAARAHAVQVILEDNGSYMPKDFAGGSYAELFKQVGFDPTLADEGQIFDQIAGLIADYLKSLDFQRDDKGDFSGSAYDEFLKINQLPQNKDELLVALAQKKSLKAVAPKKLKYHTEPSKFGPLELEGLRVFLTSAQCAQCHRPPEFTDHLFHNVGISEFEYVRKHGVDSFAALHIPDLAERLKKADQYLIPTELHPEREGVFRKTPVAENPQYVDLGMWNLFAHPDYPQTQGQLRQSLCQALVGEQINTLEACLKTPADQLLPYTVARFKTPSLRNLGQSAPYFHDGSIPDLHQILVFYMASSGMAKRGRIENPAPQLKDMHLRAGDFMALKAFLNSLNEDYD